MMKTLLVILCYCVTLITVSNTPYAESDEATYKAYLSNQDVNVTKELWKKVVKEKATAYEGNANDQDLLYRLALSQFGLLSATMRDQDEELFDTYVEATEENLEKLIEKNKTWGEPRALLSAIQGLKMGYSPWKGMYLGSKSQSLMERAKDDSPSSPLVWKLYANAKYFTPETWGGDLKEAIRAYEKSVQLYETDPQKTKSNWFYLDTLAFLGQAYQKDGQTSKAVEVYEKALKAEPDFNWIKFQLLPKAKKSATN